jgi:hypothetical protein
MNRLTAWTIAAVIAAAVAVFDLVSAWAIQLGVGLLLLTLFLFGVGIATFVALVVAGFGERRRIIAGAASSIDLVSRAARSVRWSAVAAIALSVLWFANCSGSVTTTSTMTSSAMEDVPGFLRIAAEVLLPIILIIALAAGLATAAQGLASRQQWRSAHRAAQAAVWSAVAIVFVALATVPVGFIFGVSNCDLGTSSGACAGGLAGIGDVFLVASAALLLPYILVLAHALETTSSRDNPDNPNKPAEQ